MGIVDVYNPNDNSLGYSNIGPKSRGNPHQYLYKTTRQQVKAYAKARKQQKAIYASEARHKKKHV